MMSSSFDQYSHWKTELQALDSMIRPILDTPYTGESDSFYKELQVLDLKDLANAIVNQLIDQFPKLNARERLSLSELVDQYNGVTWLTDITTKVETIEAFKANLIWFVIRDQEKDTRDAILSLRSLIEKGRALDYPVKALLQEVSELASQEDKYGWGSTRNLILNNI